VLYTGQNRPKIDMTIRNNIANFTAELTSKGCALIAVSKTQPIEKIQEAYAAGQRIFGENKAQEMTTKYESGLPRDIQWHMIGHLQRNKVKYIAPFVSLIHSVDSPKLLEEINKQGEKCGRVIPCLAQIYIANEQTKFGFDEAEFLEFLRAAELSKMKYISIEGLMGMATFTDNQDQVRSEFRKLKVFFEQVKNRVLPPNVHMKHLSMGMSGDYKIAVEEGSTMVRIGTAIFGERNYN
jgi:pyridoxal phosphate enzyme (YggS family)